MPEKRSDVQGDRRLLREARAQGRGALLKTYFRLSGPGWLQSALTLGGGSLASGLYLGTLSGFALLWLQPVAMILGIVMLGAISYVTLSTGERPFQAINRHVSPLLGWAWAIASLMANMVWSLPQYSLATSAVQQNLLPGLLGADGVTGDLGGKVIICAVILAVTISITWLYGKGGWGVKLYEGTLKVVVALIVLCFFGVVVKMTLSPGALNWGAVLSGFVPDLSVLMHPAATYTPFLEAVGETAREFWSGKILGMQRDVMISASATAVGINMTFLLGYSLLSRGWNREFRGLAIFDLSTRMLIPFLLATSCVVIASASQFHTRPAAGLVSEAEGPAPPARLVAGYQGLLRERIAATSPGLSPEERSRAGGGVAEGGEGNGRHAGEAGRLQSGGVAGASHRQPVRPSGVRHRRGGDGALQHRHPDADLGVRGLRDAGIRAQGPSVPAGLPRRRSGGAGTLLLEGRPVLAGGPDVDLRDGVAAHCLHFVLLAYESAEAPGREPAPGWQASGLERDDGPRHRVRHVRLRLQYLVPDRGSGTGGSGGLRAAGGVVPVSTEGR